jgi:hypothetical protein
VEPLPTAFSMVIHPVFVVYIHGTARLGKVKSLVIV